MNDDLCNIYNKSFLILWPPLFLCHRLAKFLKLTKFPPRTSYRWRVQEFVRGGGGAKFFFWAFQFFKGGGLAQKIAEKMTFLIKKVAKYMGNSLKFALMNFFFAFRFLGWGGGGQAPCPPLVMRLLITYEIKFATSVMFASYYIMFITLCK